MTTERTIEIFNDHDRISGLLLYGNSEDDSLFNSETIEAMNNINAILYKYQKIQEIVENRLGKPSLTILNRIIKVVEDGQNIIKN